MSKACRHGHNGGVMHRPCWECRAESEKKRADSCQTALRRLLELKNHKDAHGKDDFYQAEQPKAWAQARKVLALQDLLPRHSGK